MRKIDVYPTAEIIEQMADRAAKCSKELEKIALQMREANDITLACEAVNCMSNLYANLRMDLLVTRPIRELQRLD